MAFHAQFGAVGGAWQQVPPHGGSRADDSTTTVTIPPGSGALLYLHLSWRVASSFNSNTISRRGGI